MTISQKTPVKSEIEGNGRLSEGALGFLCAKTRDSYFDYIHSRLAEAEANGLKRAELAERIGKSPTRLSHLLGAPGNWTLDTITELLVGISREELIPHSAPLLRQKNSNMSSDDMLSHHCGRQPTYQVTISTSPIGGVRPTHTDWKYVKTGAQESA